MIYIITDMTFICILAWFSAKHTFFLASPPEWYIQPTYDTPKYWVYVLCKYQHQLKNLYSLELSHLPTTWNDITQEEAIDSL
jgi:hypothetical protein